MTRKMTRWMLMAMTLTALPALGPGEWAPAAIAQSSDKTIELGRLNDGRRVQLGVIEQFSGERKPLIARLMPGGRQVLYIGPGEEADDPNAYYLMDLNGENVRKVCDAASSDVARRSYHLAFGAGCVNPSGTLIAAMVPAADDPNRITMAVYDTQGNEIKRLTSEFGDVSGITFLGDTRFVYADHAPLGRLPRPLQKATVRRVDLATETEPEKVRTILLWDASFAFGLQRSPDGKTIVGKLHRAAAGKSEHALFAYGIEKQTYMEVAPGRLHVSPIVYKPQFNFSADSKHVLYTTKSPSSRAPILMRFTPANPPQQALMPMTTQTPDGEPMTAVRWIVPGAPLDDKRQSVWVNTRNANRGAAIDPATYEVSGMSAPALIIDRVGGTVLAVITDATGTKPGRLVTATLSFQ